MKQLKIIYILFVLALPCFAEAKTEIDLELQERLITGLLELKRFQSQEREIRNVKPERQFVGNVRTFQICAADGRAPQAKIEIEVQMRSPSGGLTHMFSNHAAISSPAPGKAMQLAMNHVINDA